jgi:prepilin-type N-terminal cleavage/methylation domain-containing protein
MRYLKHMRNQRGDTIIEVLIAMSIIGLVLGASYGIANRSLAIGRSAQERTEASKISETQVERLRQQSSQVNSPIFTIANGQAFCIANDGSISTFATSVEIKPLAQADEDLTAYPANCKYGPDGRYSASIVREDSVFSVRTRYYGIGSSKADEVLFTYRSYPFASRDLPIIITQTPTNLAANSAVFGVSITANGGTTIIETGVVYNLSSLNIVPTVDNANVVKFCDSGSCNNPEYTGTVTGFEPGTSYTIRTYARNGSGVAYGQSQTFNTSSVAPTVTTTTSSLVAVITASVSGNVTSAGGSPVTGRGVVVSASSSSPTTSSNEGFASSGTGVGEFTANLTNLLPNQTYYARVYATNSIGTNYGDAITFKTGNIDTNIMEEAGTLGTSKYFISKNTATCTQARQITTASGGHLVDINDAIENKKISDLTNGVGRIWIGANDVATEGDWVWSNKLLFWRGVANGSKISGRYSNWAPNEPNDWKAEGATPQGEDCAVMNWNSASNGNWNDWYADGEGSSFAKFVIEFD